MRLRDLLKRRHKRPAPLAVPNSVSELLAPAEVRAILDDFIKVGIVDAGCLVLIWLDKEGNIQLRSSLDTLACYGLVAMALQCQEGVSDEC